MNRAIVTGFSYPYFTDATHYILPVHVFFCSSAGTEVLYDLDVTIDGSLNLDTTATIQLAIFTAVAAFGSTIGYPVGAGEIVTMMVKL